MTSNKRPEVIRDNGMRLPTQDGPEFQKLRNAGYTHSIVAYYSTTFDVLPNHIINIFIKKLLPEGSFVQMTNFSKGTTPAKHITQRHYVDGKETLEILDPTGLLSGNYLIVACPYKIENKKKDKNNIISAIDKFVAGLSLIHSPHVAAERHMLVISNLLHHEIQVVSNEIWSSAMLQTDRELSDSITNALKTLTFSDIDSNPEVFFLLGRAHHETDPTHRFLSYWLAVEVAIGNGAQRKNFALKALKSEEVNNKINELRVLRNAYLHEGKIIRPTFFDGVILKLIILMKICTSSEIRKNLLDLFNDILKREDSLRAINISAYTCNVTIKKS